MLYPGTVLDFCSNVNQTVTFAGVDRYKVDSDTANVHACVCIFIVLFCFKVY